MQPTILEKSLIVGVEFDQREVQVDDIVVFNINEGGREKYITHRVIGVDQANGTVSTKGDANSVPDLFDESVFPNGLPMENIVYRVDYIFNIVAVIITSLTASYTAPILLTIILFGVYLIWKLLKDMFYDRRYDLRLPKEEREMGDLVNDLKEGLDKVESEVANEEELIPDETDVRVSEIKETISNYSEEDYLKSQEN